MEGLWPGPVHPMNASVQVSPADELNADPILLYINVRYFAVFRERAGRGAESLYTGASTPSQLYRQLCLLHPLKLDACCVKVSINSEFASWDARLRDGDVVVFIPPVAGG